MIRLSGGIIDDAGWSGGRGGGAGGGCGFERMLDPRTYDLQDFADPGRMTRPGRFSVLICPDILFN
jgi:hypothetical protein